MISPRHLFADPFESSVMILYQKSRSGGKRMHLFILLEEMNNARACMCCRCVAALYDWNNFLFTIDCQLSHL